MTFKKIKGPTHMNMNYCDILEDLVILPKLYQLVLKGDIDQLLATLLERIQLEIICYNVHQPQNDSKDFQIPLWYLSQKT